ncbi:hypothetical protein [Amycolatopsis sp. NPDC051371]|uniref:hypothetical protein n=1 Tax=Amycolatopsis sp. NPDC051371 TaxID=3155800 RepID=UPI00341702CA
MKRAAAIAAALLALVTLLPLRAVGALAAGPAPSPSRPAAAAWTPVRDLDGAAGARCDTAEAADAALTRLGEYRVAVVVVGQPEIDAVVPMGSAAYAEPTPDGDGQIVLSNLPGQVPCRYAWATVAHELAHVWQFRSGDTDYTPEDEIVADCAGALTGWPDYAPYLTARHAHGGPVGCSSGELAEARQLRRWAR